MTSANSKANSRAHPKARFLMCPPKHFEVAYTINPWMDPRSWARDNRTLTVAAQKEWERLYRTIIELGAQIELVPPVKHLPDLVFTANSAVVLNGKALLARFRYAERRAEEPYFEQAFRALHDRGLIRTISTLPHDTVLEGAGDCVFDSVRNLFWMGYGTRSDEKAKTIVKNEFGVDVVALELADPRFYHMDTALRPLPGGQVMYYPNAFTAVGRAAIRERVTPADRIEIKFFDARRLAANAVSIGKSLLLSDCSSNLCELLTERGYQVITTPLKSFLRSGGSSFCLTLRLDLRAAETRSDRNNAILARIA